MAKISYNRTSAGFGPTIASAKTRNTPIGTVIQTTVPKGHAGVLTTRTNGANGIVTLPAGHGLFGPEVDIYWEGGRSLGVDVSISGNSATVTYLGDASTTPLPPVNTPVVLSVIHTFAHPVATDTLDFLSLQLLLNSGATGIKGRISLRDYVPEDSGAEVEIVVDIESGELVVNDVEEGEYNSPWDQAWTRYPQTWKMSHASALSDGVMNIVLLNDPTSESSS